MLLSSYDKDHDNNREVLWESYETNKSYQWSTDRWNQIYVEVHTFSYAVLWEEK